MPIQAYERALSSDTTFDPKSSSAKRLWQVLGTDDHDEAYAAIAAAAPQTILAVSGETLVRGPMQVTDANPLSLEIRVDYISENSPDSKEDPEAGAWSFSFDTSGGTHKITQSKGNVWRGSRTMDIETPDLKGGLNWDGKKLQGIEIFVGKLEFSIKASYNPAFVDVPFFAGLASNTAKINGADWLGFNAGELLYLGSAGDGETLLRFGTASKPVQVTHKFAYSANQVNITIGDILVPSKKGWQHLSVYYQKIEQEGNLFPVPEHAWVDDIYEETDFPTVFSFGGS